MMFTPSARHLRAALVLSLLATTSCDRSPTGLTPTALSAAKRRWALTAPAAYQVTISHGCFCVPDVNRPVIVTVRDGQVQSRRYVDTGVDVDPRLASAFPAINELFGIIDDAIARHSERVDVTFDAARGFPITVAIDGAAGIADDESFYGTRDFIAR